MKAASLKFWLALLPMLAAAGLNAQLVHYDWPTGPDAAMKSEQYRVWVRLGADAERQLTVLRSDAIYEGGEYVDGEAADLKGRTFSFAQVSYDPTCGKALTFRVEKIFGMAADKITLAPRSYGLLPNVNQGGREVSFQITNANRYVSVNFDTADNHTVYHGWIKHMLCVFVDPQETDVPDTSASGVVVYRPQVETKVLNDAKVICFPPGHHNLKGVQKPGSIEDEGKLIIRDGQAVYLAGGAFLEAHIHYAGNDQKIFGRGILSGRQYIWHKSIKDRRSIISLGNRAELKGILIKGNQGVQIPKHSIIAPLAFLKTEQVNQHALNDCVG